MSTTKHEATLTVVQCDFPRCNHEYDSYSSEKEFRFPEQPQGWEHVRLGGDNNRFVLCPDHAQHASVAQLVDAMVNGKVKEQVAPLAQAIADMAVNRLGSQSGPGVIARY